ASEAGLLEIEREDRHLEIAGTGFLLVEEQDPDVFLADIDLGRIGLARAGNDTDALGVELASQIGSQCLEVLDSRGLVHRSLDLQIVGTLVVLIVDGQAPDALLADKDIGFIGFLWNYPQSLIAEQFLEIGIELLDFLDVHRSAPRSWSGIVKQLVHGA